MNRQYSIDDVLGNGGAEAIEAAIADSELRTSSEIVVRIKASVAPADVRTAAEQEFERLGLGLERRLHGILLFISREEMQLELIADDGIYTTVSKEI
jgi:uncharacterized membrane protein